MSFDKIYYKGKALQPLEKGQLVVDDSVSEMTFAHIYRSTFGATGDGRHMCMQWGHWCWRQAWEHPIDAVRFIAHTLKRIK